MQRAGISAEAYGAWNQKGDFIPKVIPKSESVRGKLKERLTKAFMFNALEENELEIVIDSIEEVNVS
jgi:cAMP-dependent protein kinase regulator